MSFKEVKELRKEGKLQEALAMANADLEHQPDNIWNKRSMGWVIYDFAKEASSKNDFDALKQNIEKLISLNLPEDEKMLYSNFVWPIAKYLFHIGSKEDYNRQEVTTLFNLCQSIPFEKPSDNYSILLKSFLKFSHTWSSFKEFVHWWDLKNLRPEDYLKETLPNGKTVMALAEQLYIAYARKLLEGEGANPFDLNKVVNKKQVIAFLEKLDILIEKHPEYQYPAYFKAKLLLTLGSNEDVLSAFLPFAKKKKNEFWVWELMAEIFHSDPKKAIACYSKALCCKVSPEFLVKTRQHFAKILIDQKLFSEAKTEIEKAIKIRVEQGWKLPIEITNWQNEKWYPEAKDLGHNDAFYKSHISEAEVLLFHDVRPEVGIIEFVNKDKKVLNFLVSKEIHGFFKYEGLIKNPLIGDAIELRLEKRIGDEGAYYFVFSASRTLETPSSEIKKAFEGTIRKKDENDFAFVDDIFIEPSIVKGLGLTHGSFAKGFAILSYNRKKATWSWKAREIKTSK